MEKRTETPKPERFVVDHDRLTIEGKSTRSRTLSLQDYPVLWGFVESFRATLNGDLAALERFYTVDFTGAQGGWQLSLAPKDRKMAAVIRAIRIAGHDARVDTVEVEEAQGDRSVMRMIEDSG